MRNLGYKLVMLFLSGIVFSCSEESLDKIRTDQLSTTSFWSNEVDANAGLTAIYDALETNTSYPDGAWGAFGLYDLITPIANSRDPLWLSVAEGNHSGNSVRAEGTWAYCYRGVARANDFLVNIDDIPFVGEDADTVKATMKAEASFLRAMFYYLLVELWGDVPLFEEVPTAEDAFTERSPKEDVLNFMKDDLNFAINNLPEPGDEEVGRATIGAAMALRVKVALYEKDWPTAATVSGQIMELGYSLVPNYEDVINLNNENNEEIIFDVQHVFLNDAENGGYFEKWYASRSATASGFSWFQPTRWLVDQYERIIPNPQEGVDYINEDPSRIPNEIYEYFEGRDPRMDHTILRAGSHLIDLNDQDRLYPHQIQSPNHSQTGMHVRKYVSEGSGTSAQYDSPLNYVVFRYADILLNHLEAKAMESGGAENVSQGVLDETINAVRKRASDNLPLYTSGNITMEDIYRERIVELAFEGWTYFDMKRNGMIEINDGYEVMGFTVVAGSSVDFNPEKVNQTRIFNPEIHYLFPIPSNEIQRSSNALKQNPGYAN